MSSKKNTERLEYVKLQDIYPHPENPRKNLGDLSELAESIKKNGIMQNLTIIPGHWLSDKEYKAICAEYKKNPNEELRQVMNNRWTSGGYTLLIGHRRCAAAKLAGLEEVPCRVVKDMSRKEQISTMLEENMQRNDLTILEQAQGFQMMLDLGDTEEQIAEKTGFSKVTIRRRLNIAKLDQEELRKKEEDGSFQLTLSDLYELEKVEDIATRNKILKEARNSRDLTWKAQNAVNEAVRKKRTEAIISLLEAAGVQKAPKVAETEQYTGKWEVLQEYSLEKDPPKRIKISKQEEIYYLVFYRSVRIIRKAKKAPVSPEEIARKEKDKIKKEIAGKMKNMSARRKDFITNIVNGKIAPLKKDEDILMDIWNVLMEAGSYLSISKFIKFFTNKTEYECTPEEKKNVAAIVRDMSMLHQMLVLLHSAMSDSIGDIYTYDGYYQEKKGELYLKAYGILERYGWFFEGDEKELLLGTHALYSKRPEVKTK